MLFIESGFTYFDTSYVYHNGKSEEAARKAVVERYPRDSFTIAAKFPTFSIQSEEEIEPIFEQQLKNLGVDYIDYYLLHNIQTKYYDGIVKKTHLFEHELRWKEEGKIRHPGFSFHSSAKLLDRILTEHPEVEFVQIVVNYLDWDSEFIQARKCYETCRKHGVDVVIMESVKGGALAKLNEEAERILKVAAPDRSIASWAMRFLKDLDGVIACLSGMSSYEQAVDNIDTMKNAGPLSDAEKEALRKALLSFRNSAVVKPETIEKLQRLLHGTAHLRPVFWKLMPTVCFSPILIFAAEHNYYSNVLLENGNIDMRGELPEEKIVLADGTDGSRLVRDAGNG